MHWYCPFKLANRNLQLLKQLNKKIQKLRFQCNKVLSTVACWKENCVLLVAPNRSFVSSSQMYSQSAKKIIVKNQNKPYLNSSASKYMPAIDTQHAIIENVMWNTFLLWFLRSLYDIIRIVPAAEIITPPTIPTIPISIALSKFWSSSPCITPAIPKETVKTATMSWVMTKK